MITQYTETNYKNGRESGREWAATGATPEAITRLRSFYEALWPRDREVVFSHPLGLLSVVQAIEDDEDMSDGSWFWESVADNESTPDAGFVEGFINGAIGT